MSLIRLHEDGTSQVSLSSAPPAEFFAAAIASGLAERVCRDCGRPWLSRGTSELCPVCDPSHVGYEPAGPVDKPRWVAYWHEALCNVLERRMERLARRQVTLAVLGRPTQHQGQLAAVLASPRRQAGLREGPSGYIRELMLLPSPSDPPSDPSP